MGPVGILSHHLKPEFSLLEGQFLGGDLTTTTKFSGRKKAILQGRSVKLIFTGGRISLTVAFKGPNVILGLYKCNCSLTVK